MKTLEEETEDLHNPDYTRKAIQYITVDYYLSYSKIIEFKARI